LLYEITEKENYLSKLSLDVSSKSNISPPSFNVPIPEIENNSSSSPLYSNFTSASFSLPSSSSSFSSSYLSSSSISSPLYSSLTSSLPSSSSSSSFSTTSSPLPSTTSVTSSSPETLGNAKYLSPSKPYSSKPSSSTPKSHSKYSYSANPKSSFAAKSYSSTSPKSSSTSGKLSSFSSAAAVSDSPPITEIQKISVNEKEHDIFIEKQKNKNISPASKDASNNDEKVKEKKKEEEEDSESSSSSSCSSSSTSASSSPLSYASVTSSAASSVSSYSSVSSSPLSYKSNTYYRRKMEDSDNKKNKNIKNDSDSKTVEMQPAKTTYKKKDGISTAKEVNVEVKRDKIHTTYLGLLQQAYGSPPKKKDITPKKFNGGEGKK
jgi:hypothetical protein